MSDALFDSLQYAVRRTQVEQFVAPPLTLLDGNQGYWRDRKRAWLLDYPQLHGAAGRDAPVFSPGSSDTEISMQIANCGSSMTSVFDPVLAELAYSWYTAPEDVVYDPFAGGPCRGVVASALGRIYLGVDVRQEQVDANWEVEGADDATWVCADSATFTPPPCDFILTCPPYGNLERYSDDPQDLSSLSWERFVPMYVTIIGRAVGALQRDRFAVFVVANYKENRRLRDLIGETVSAFEAAGAEYFCDIVHATPIGTAAVRSQVHFPVNRRPIPRHQMMLVFAKGDARAAADRLKAFVPSLAVVEE